MESSLFATGGRFFFDKMSPGHYQVQAIPPEGVNLAKVSGMKLLPRASLVVLNVIQETLSVDVSFGGSVINDAFSISGFRVEAGAELSRKPLSGVRISLYNDNWKKVCT